MYSIDGVALKNATYNWRLKRDSTNPFGSISRSLIDFNSSGRDGTIQVRGYTTTPTITLNITTPLAYLDDLRQLLRLGSTMTMTSDATQALTVELVTLTVTPWALPSSGVYLVSAVLRCPNVYWRDVSTTDYGPTAISSNGQTVTAFTPSTAPVRDALISIGGSITGLAVQGSAGTFYSYGPNIPSGTWLTFDSSTGRAYAGNAAFVQTTELTSAIANGRGPYFLEMIGSSNPATLGSPLVVTYTSASGATITVRGKNAYDR